LANLRFRMSFRRKLLRRSLIVGVDGAAFMSRLETARAVDIG
jgi:hypothetical protein